MFGSNSLLHTNRTKYYFLKIKHSCDKSKTLFRQQSSFISLQSPSIVTASSLLNKHCLLAATCAPPATAGSRILVVVVRGLAKFARSLLFCIYTKPAGLLLRPRRDATREILQSRQRAVGEILTSMCAGARGRCPKCRMTKEVKEPCGRERFHILTWYCAFSVFRL